jgi:hypothetical protein
MQTLKITLLSAAAVLGLAGAQAAHADPLSSPSMTPPLSANPNPISFDAGPVGKVFVSGQVTGLALAQDHPIPGDHDNYGDVSNAQVEIQKTDGVFQFYIQGGTYSLPSLGAPYLKSSTIAKDTFGNVPVAYVKLVPNANFNVMIGKLPTLIGAEYTFTFQNMNIARGLLWNQEPAVSRGVQVNFTKDKWAVSASINDGFYSDKYSTGSALITYTASASDTFAFAASGNFDKQSTSTFATPIAQNNGQVYNLMWTHTQGPWVVTPYFQYTRVPKITKFGIPNEASTTGGAILAKYTINPSFSLAGRAEYESSSGSGVSLLYGPSSKAWSLTLTPTYQVKTFFIRGEVSYTGLDSAAPGFGFGTSGNSKSQTRAMVETGFLF